MSLKVFRGTYSEACDNCRRNKRGCDQRRPSCSRCERTGKVCSRSRQPGQIRFYDETRLVKEKVNGPSDATKATLTAQRTGQSFSPTTFPLKSTSGDGSGRTIQYFLEHFTAEGGKWFFLRNAEYVDDELVRAAMLACGMAALHSKESLSVGQERFRSAYSRAIALLNLTIQDPDRCKDDSALIAVSLLGFCENLTCEDGDSVKSWRAHVSGAAQLLQLRGLEQFRTSVGRSLYRELRERVITDRIWADLEPSPFMAEYEEELRTQSQDDEGDFGPSDALYAIALDFARLRSRMRCRSASTGEASAHISDVSTRLDEWEIVTRSRGKEWRYHIHHDHAPSDHVWNGIVHTYSSSDVTAVWSSYRTLRIMITRAQAIVYGQQAQLGSGQPHVKMIQLRQLRQQITDDICASIPSQLGHYPPYSNADGVYHTALASIWPLFFAATCALDEPGRHGTQIFSEADANAVELNAATAQATWLIGRLHYISTTIGLNWATGFIKVLHGDFRDFKTFLQPTSEPDGKEYRGPKILLQRDFAAIRKACSLRSLSTSSTAHPTVLRGADKL